MNFRFRISNFKFLVFFLFVTTMFAQNKPCQLDSNILQFIGKPIEQARCLLRPNKIGGVLGQELKNLPKPFEKIIGKKVEIKKEKLRKYLQKKTFDEQTLGGNLDQQLSKAKLPNGEEIQSLYFVIHDTSTPNYLEKDFPKDINEKTWRFNNNEMWLKNPVAHIFVNRLGESITTTPFDEPVKKGFGTKFARDYLKADAKALQIHIELVQPRKSDTTKSKGNDLFSPEIGFTDAQYEKLALLYVCASVRRGTWLIPAYHSAIDAGIKDAHDDPQNFDLNKFAVKLSELLKKF
ncbi:MAG: hypothetical protein MUC29_02305 [Pyrinomonadaceae bacterium]|nr:hypothetical protein [Pyrinomonadaceae bacterium]